MRFLSLALRNVVRNRRRSVLTAIAVSFGVAALVLLQGFIQGFIDAGVEASVLGRVGAIQVQRRGFIGADEPLELAMQDDPRLVARIRAVPGVTAVAPRLEFDGMVSNGADATLFTAVAIDAASEYRVCPGRATTVVAGGAPLGPSDIGRALVGRALAESLSARPGSSLMLQSASPAAAGTNALDVEVSGLLTSLDFGESKHLVTVPISFARELLRMPSAVTSYVVGVAELTDVTTVAARVAATLKEPSRSGSDYEVTTFNDVDVRLREQIAQARGVFGFVALVLFLLVAAGIVNTTNLAVQERVREIGTMLAVGMRRRQVLHLFVEEAAALGLFSAALGAALGWGLVSSIGLHGITLHPPGGDALVVRPTVPVVFIFGVVTIAVAFAAGAALRPAFRASRLSPVDALRAL